MCSPLTNSNSYLMTFPNKICHLVANNTDFLLLHNTGTLRISHRIMLLISYVNFFLWI